MHIFIVDIKTLRIKSFKIDEGEATADVGCPQPVCLPVSCLGMGPRALS